MALLYAESQTRSGMSSRGRSTKPRRYTGSGDSDDEVSEGTNKRRKHHNPWSVQLLPPCLCAVCPASPSLEPDRSTLVAHHQQCSREFFHNGEELYKTELRI